jgi:peptidoglycan/LPS O-acetylase OafA/YrhL
MSTPQAESESPPDHLQSLTSLRFVAALAVLVLHYRDLLGPLPAWVVRGMVGGQYGVTFFFILSGFILTYRYHEWFAGGVADASYWKFVRYRMARIYPIYVFGLLLDTPWHLLERAQAGQLGGVGQVYWASWLLNLVGLQAWVPAVPFAMFWNTPAWSVAAEFFFYAGFPFVCAALARRSRTTLWLASMLGVTVLGGIGLYAAVIHGLTDMMPVAAETQYIVLVYNPLLRYSEFFAGCLAGHYFLGHRPKATAADAAGARSEWLRNLVVVACLAAVAARVWMPDYTGPSRERWLFDVSVKYGIFIVPFTLLILAVASGRTWLSKGLELRWMILLGEASYSLYIIHWAFVTPLHMGYLGKHGTPAVHLLVMLATIGASVLCYRYIETPLRKRLRGNAGALRHP